MAGAGHRESVGRAGIDRCAYREKCVNSALEAPKLSGASMGVTMAVVELTLFGGFQVRLAAGQVIDLPGQKDRALLAILALPAGTTRSRDKLASLLWSDRGDQQARDSLKHALTRLRQCLE